MLILATTILLKQLKIHWVRIRIWSIPKSRIHIRFIVICRIQIRSKSCPDPCKNDFQACAIITILIMRLWRQERWYSGGEAVFWMRGKLRSVRPPPQGDQVTQDEDDETLAPHTRQAQVCLLLSFCLPCFPFYHFLSLYMIALRLSFSLPCFPFYLSCRLLE